MANIFDTLEKEAFRAGITPRTKESRDWFRKRISTIRRVNRRELMNAEQLQQGTQFKPGAMTMFFYQPKLRESLPYYDSFPLTIVVDKADGGFYGLNMHYLPPMLRAKFLDGLMENQQNDRFAVTYNFLKRTARLKYFKPCFKHYLTGHVRSKFAFIPKPEWEIAAFLPTADFQKAGKDKVYSDSRRIING